MAGIVDSWFQDTTRIFWSYMRMAGASLPFGVIYATLELHHENSPWTIGPLLAGGLLLGYYWNWRVGYNPFDFSTRRK